MPAIITTKNRLQLAKQFYENFNTVPGNAGMYMFVGKVTAWPNESNPPVPGNTDAMHRQAWRDMIGGKKVSPADFSYVIRRVNWTSGKIFVKYTDSNTNLFFQDFYCVTDDFNVYKCIENNGGGQSTVKPTGTSNAIITLGDGYKWKYMCSINTGDAIKFLTVDWMPVKFIAVDDGSAQFAAQENAVPGALQSFDITNGGAGYTVAPSVTITGDGSGATATATISGGVVTKINVVTPGQDYNYATVSLSGGTPTTAAVVNPIYAPMGTGHGGNAVLELGAFYVMINAELDQDENGNLPTVNEFRNIGLMVDPDQTDGTSPATLSAFNQTTVLQLGSIVGTLQLDATITGNTSGTTATIVQVDTTNAIVSVNNVIGQFLPGEAIQNVDGNGLISTVTDPEMAPYTGQIIFMENRAPISRAPDQTEQVRVIFEF